jgi:hypothetical protein
MAMPSYHIIHGRETGWASKDGWYVKQTNGVTRVLHRRYDTWLQARAAADRLTKLECDHPYAE